MSLDDGKTAVPARSERPARVSTGTRVRLVISLAILAVLWSVTGSWTDVLAAIGAGIAGYGVAMLTERR